MIDNNKENNSHAMLVQSAQSSAKIKFYKSLVEEVKTPKEALLSLSFKY